MTPLRAVRRQGAREAGAATVLVVAVSGLLLVIGAAVGVVAALVVDHRRAQSAADLAALAGAVAAGRGVDPCREAQRIATANGAAVGTCVVAGRDVLVEVVVTGPAWWGWDGLLTARARAGPGSAARTGRGCRRGRRAARSGRRRACRTAH